VGEVWKTFLKGSAGDDGQTPILGGGGFLRALCANLTTETLETIAKRIVHRGGTMQDQVRALISGSAKALNSGLEGFTARQIVLAETPIAAVLEGKTIKDQIAELVDGYSLDKAVAGAVKRDALTDMLLRNFELEPGETLAHLVGAVTRLHESRLPVLAISQVEQAAGLMARDLAGRAQRGA